MHKHYIIAPLLTLPMKRRIEDEETVLLPVYLPAKRNLAFLLGVEVLYALAAGELGSLAFFYLAPWPIYRIVAFVALFIVWSNFASALARNKSTKQQAVEILHTMRPKKQELTTDTTAYLVALRKTTLR